MSDDRSALAELTRVVAPGAVQTLLHYLYVPSPAAAREAGLRLRAHGFSTEEGLGVDGNQWLVLARHQFLPSPEGIAVVRALMEDLARSHGGEYDGWEADLTEHVV